LETSWTEKYLDLENMKREICQEHFDSTEHFVLLDSERYNALNDYTCSQDGGNKKYVEKFSGKNFEKNRWEGSIWKGF
jgi:hypothetical protein